MSQSKIAEVMVSGIPVTVTVNTYDDPIQNSIGINIDDAPDDTQMSKSETHMLIATLNVALEYLEERNS